MREGSPCFPQSFKESAVPLPYFWAKRASLAFPVGVRCGPVMCQNVSNVSTSSDLYSAEKNGMLLAKSCWVLLLWPCKFIKNVKNHIAESLKALFHRFDRTILTKIVKNRIYFSDRLATPGPRTSAVAASLCIQTGQALEFQRSVSKKHGKCGMFNPMFILIVFRDVIFLRIQVDFGFISSNNRTYSFKWIQFNLHIILIYVTI